MTRHTTLVATVLAVVTTPWLLAGCSDTTEPTAAAADPASDVRDLPVSGNESVDLSAGRYRVPLAGGLSFEIDLPSGSSTNNGGLYILAGDDVLKVEVAGPTYGSSTDPCRSPSSIVPAGPGLDDLVTAIGDQPALRVGAAEPASLGGADGQRISARLPESYDASACTNVEVGLPGHPESINNVAPGYSGDWWFLDVEGQRVVVHRCSMEDAGPLAEAVESITFTTTS